MRNYFLGNVCHVTAFSRTWVQSSAEFCTEGCHLTVDRAADYLIRTGTEAERRPAVPTGAGQDTAEGGEVEVRTK